MSGALRLIYRLLTAGTALTNSTTETSLASYTFGANALQIGSVIRFRAVVRSTATNSTDTLVIKAKFGGTAFVTTAAVDQVDGDVCVIEGTIVVRDADSSGTVVASGFASASDATGTVAGNGHAVLISSLNFTSTLTLDVTGTWSAASANDSCQAEALEVWVAA